MLTPGSAAMSSVVTARNRSTLRRASARTGLSSKFDIPVKISEGMFAHGQLVYLQIPATDIAASGSFYERVLGWQVDPPESGFTAPGLIGQWVTDRAPAPRG